MNLNVCRTIVLAAARQFMGQNKTLIFEDQKLEPINPYGQTKFVIEIYSEICSKVLQEWKIINLRYFNPIGAHSSG